MKEVGSRRSFIKRKRSKVERVLRFGNIGYFAPNMVVVAGKK